MVEVRDYYALRRGSVRPSETIESLRRIITSDFVRLETEGLFQWHFGKECVDDGYIPGKTARSDPGAYTQWALGRDLWPFDQSLLELDEEWLFSAIEFLHDHAAAPTHSTPHTWGDCGIHVNAANEAEGRKEYRESVNRYLSRYKSGFQIQDSGEIWPSAPSGLEYLRPAETGEISFDKRVSHAIATFRRRSATEEDKRDAIKNLADILELLREQGNTNLPKRDEARLFEIANQYAIRHFDSRQRTEYDSGVWLDWIFYAFLNAIALATGISERESTTGYEGPAAGDLPFE